MTDTEKARELLDGLTIVDWLQVVGDSAQARYSAMRQHSSNAGTFYAISTQCSRLRKFLKRIKI